MVDLLSMGPTRDEKRLVEVRHQIEALTFVNPDGFNIAVRADGLTKLEVILAGRIAASRRERTI
jgi:hypothetical protein